MVEEHSHVSSIFDCIFISTRTRTSSSTLHITHRLILPLPRTVIRFAADLFVLMAAFVPMAQ